MSFVLAHLGLLAIPTLAIVALVAAGFFFGPALVLNRWVLGAVGLALVVFVIGWKWEGKKEELRKEGAQVCEAKNAEDLLERRSTISHFVVRAAETETKLRGQLAAALSNLDMAQQQREEGPKRVTAKADAGCAVPAGFLRSYDAALPGAAGRPPIPAAGADDDRPTGIPLSRITTEIQRDLTLCSKYVEQVNTCEQSRYEACKQWDATFGTNSGCTR